MVDFVSMRNRHGCLEQRSVIKHADKLFQSVIITVCFMALPQHVNISQRL